MGFFSEGFSYGFRCTLDAFHMDLRSMALFRILMGLTVVADVIDRMGDLRMHYTDDGFCPRVLFIPLWAPMVPSVYFMSGLWYHVLALAFLHILVALCWAAGYRTRLMHFLTWFFTWSLQNRNVPNGHGGDMYMRMMLFWSFFLPLGAAFSVDEWTRRRAAFPRRHRAVRRAAWSWDFAPVLMSNKVVGPATAGFLLQVLIMYIASVLHKDGAEWRSLGTSTWLALNLNYFRTPLGHLFYQLPGVLMKYLTFAVLVAEVASPALCLSPLLPAASRLLGVVSILSLHFGFGLALRLGVFTPVTITVALAMLPTAFWDQILLPLLRALTARPLPLAVALPPSALPLAEFALPEGFLASAPCFAVAGRRERKSTEISRSILTGKSKSKFGGELLVIDATGRGVRGAAAALELLAHSPLGWWAAYLPVDALFGADHVRVPPPAMQRLKRAAAAWSARAGAEGGDEEGVDAEDEMDELRESTSTMTMPPAFSTDAEPARWGGAAGWRFAWRAVRGVALAAVLGAALTYVLVWNSLELEYISRYPFQGWVEPLTVSTGLEQRWSMFSHSPPYDSFWIEVQGVLVDHRLVDIFDDGGLWDLGRLKPWNDSKSWGETPYEWRNIRNHRHFKYWENYIQVEGMREEFGRWLCREFNRRHAGLDALMEHYVYVQHVRTEDEGPGVYNGRVQLSGHLCYRDEDLTEEQLRAWRPIPAATESSPDADADASSDSLAFEVDPNAGWIRAAESADE